MSSQKRRHPKQICYCVIHQHSHPTQLYKLIMIKIENIENENQQPNFKFIVVHSRNIHTQNGKPICDNVSTAILERPVGKKVYNNDDDKDNGQRLIIIVTLITH